MLSQVHTRHAIQEIPLQTQGDRSARGLLDGGACLRNVDALDSLAVYLSIVRDQPIVNGTVSVSWSS